MELASYSDAANHQQIDHAGIVHLEHEVADLMAGGDATVLARWILARESKLVPREKLEAALDQFDVLEKKLMEANLKHRQVQGFIDNFMLDVEKSLSLVLTKRLDLFGEELRNLWRR